MRVHLRTIVLPSLMIAALGACRARHVPRAPEVLPLTRVFGPIVGNEVIAGRANDEDSVWLLAGGTDLVHADLATHRVRRVGIKLAPGERCWGLARLEDGSLWTLKGRHAVIQIDAEGAIVKETPLAEPHLGLFGAGERLVYQQASFTPPGPALIAAVPGVSGTTVWSDMTTRTFDRMARTSVVALNMVGCGDSAGGERPCWFPDEAAISLIDAAGRTRRLALTGLDVAPPEILLTAENPPRPVRDAYVDGEGRVWVLSTGAPPAGGADRPGGWILARYGSRGVPIGIQRLAESARLIMRAGAGRAVLLTGTGMVAEVTP